MFFVSCLNASISSFHNELLFIPNENVIKAKKKQNCKRSYSLKTILVFYLLLFLVNPMQKFFHSRTFLAWILIMSCYLTLFRMGLFGAAHGWGEGGPLSLKSSAHILQWWNVGQFYTLPKKDSKYIWITWHTPWLLLRSGFFHWKSTKFAISRNTDIDCILVHNFSLF